MCYHPVAQIVVAVETPVACAAALRVPQHEVEFAAMPFSHCSAQRRWHSTIAVSSNGLLVNSESLAAVSFVDFEDWMSG